MKYELRHIPKPGTIYMGPGEAWDILLTHDKCDRMKWKVCNTDDCWPIVVIDECDALAYNLTQTEYKLTRIEE